MAQIERNQDASVFIGNLDERCTDALIWELMMQAGPVVNVHLPKERTTLAHQGYGFCEFLTAEDAEYAIAVMDHLRVYDKAIRIRKLESRAAPDKQEQQRPAVDVGATLHVSNLDPQVDEKMLYDVFSVYGQILHTPKLARDPDTGAPRGFALISFDSFDAADQAIDGMNNQNLMNKPVLVTYSFLKKAEGGGRGKSVHTFPE